jgi:hypothetical protein
MCVSRSPEKRVITRGKSRDRLKMSKAEIQALARLKMTF